MNLGLMWAWVSCWLVVSLYGSGLTVLPNLGWRKPRLLWISRIFTNITEYQFTLIRGRVSKSYPQIVTFEDFVKSKWYYHLIVDATCTEGYSFEEKLQRYFWCLIVFGSTFAAIVLGVFFGI